MFFKKKSNLIDDSKVIAKDFLNRTPYYSHQPTEYGILTDVHPKGMFKKLDKMISKLLESDIDAGNCDALDQYIYAELVRSENHLYQQFLNHQNIIRQLGIRRAADYEDFKKIAAILEAQLADLKIELEKIEGGNNYVQKG